FVAGVACSVFLACGFLRVAFGSLVLVVPMELSTSACMLCVIVVRPVSHRMSEWQAWQTVMSSCRSALGGRDLGGRCVMVGNATPRPVAGEVSLSSSSSGGAWWRDRRLVWSGSGVVGARRRRSCIVKATLGFGSSKSVGMLVPFLVVVWGTLGCSILAGCLPADVPTALRVATSEEVSPRSDATLSQRRAGLPYGPSAVLFLLVVATPFTFTQCSALEGLSARQVVTIYWDPLRSLVGRQESTAGKLDGVSHAVSKNGRYCLWALDLVEVCGGCTCGETMFLTWLLGVSYGDTWLFLPYLMEVRDVGACVMRLWSHVVAPVFRELLCLGGCVPRVASTLCLTPLSSFTSAVVGVPASLAGLWIRGWRRNLRESLAGVQEVGWLAFSRGPSVSYRSVLLLLLGGRAVGEVAEPLAVALVRVALKTVLSKMVV
ncbi:hypothetical protein Taro_028094, partial [Colocasia esculenta]|nr:hypothetical protein [Colocasia esculenta]